MAYTGTAQVGMTLTLQQVFDATSLPGATGAGATLTHNQFNMAETTYNSSSSVPVTDVLAFKKTLSSGTGTVDLTSLTGTLGEAVTLLGKKVQAVILYNPTANANSITITEGASNGHALMGTAWKVILLPGQRLTWFGNEASEDVASGDKTWDLTGTGSQYLYIAIAAG